LAEVETIPEASGVTAEMDDTGDWAAARHATSTNKNPVFFMLPPTGNSPKRPGTPLSISQYRGYSGK
jgi:hypothetical protein